MAFDTFDEGINYGGVRSKNEIRTLICYLFNSINKPLDKPTIIEAIQKRGLASYFETSSCFDDLISHNNLSPDSDNPGCYTLTENGKMVAKQLENTLPVSVQEKAYICAIELFNTAVWLFGSDVSGRSTVFTLLQQLPEHPCPGDLPGDCGT